MTTEPNPTPEQTPPAPAPQTTPAPTPPSPQGFIDPTGQGRTPLFIAWEQNDLNNKFGEARTDGRTALAKKYGFETIEAFDAHMQTTRTQADELSAKTTALNEAQASIASMKLDGEAERQARLLGVPEENIKDVLKFRDPSAGEMDTEGNISGDAIKGSLETFLGQYPAFKQPKNPATVGTTGSNPAGGAGAALTIDQQIAKAQAENNHQRVIELQTQKMYMRV